MNRPEFRLTDSHRVRLFAAIAGMQIVLRKGQVNQGQDGTLWRSLSLGGIEVAVSSEGPGWRYDPNLREELEQDLADAQATSDAAVQAILPSEKLLDQNVSRIRQGQLAARVCWAIHEAILHTQRSTLHISDEVLADAVWGHKTRRPKTWRQTLRAILEGLTYLHVRSIEAEGEPLPWGLETSLMLRIVDLRRSDGDNCDYCPAQEGTRHCHFLVVAGPGFLGCMEQLGMPVEGGYREYDFYNKKAVSRVSRTGPLVEVYMPMVLGDPVACSVLTPSQQFLLHTLLRERTLDSGSRGSNAREQHHSGQFIPTINGRDRILCRLLGPGSTNVGFNGNGTRKGLGYLVESPAGWMSRAGYQPGEVAVLLKDLQHLADELGIVPVGILEGRCLSVAEMLDLIATPVGRNRMGQLHLRVYAPADYLSQWNDRFRLPAFDQRPAREELILDAIYREITASKQPRSAVAKVIGVDPSFLGKVLKGKKPMPANLLEKIRHLRMGTLRKPQADNDLQTAICKCETDDVAMIEVANCCHDLGWSLVPQHPGEKHPCVNWKQYQSTPATKLQLAAWLGQWPDAGLAVVLGPVSDLFVIDVDGHEAYEALLDHLGLEPIAPKALSGSGKPDRFHLYFRHPDVETKAKFTPWHPDLEFRGHGGVVIMPPSLHPSGNRYRWEIGQSPADLALPAVPASVLAALRERELPVQPTLSDPAITRESDKFSQSTQEFLKGDYCDGPQWNQRLFKAACDLEAANIPEHDAMERLVRGARPMDAANLAIAKGTIHSAYGRRRTPSRC